MANEKSPFAKGETSYASRGIFTEDYFNMDIERFS